MVHSFDYLTKHFPTGTVYDVYGSLIHSSPMEGATYGEMVAFEEGQYGRIMGVHTNMMDVMLLSRKPIQAGSKIVRTGRQASITIDDGYLGKTLDPLGHVLESWKTHHTTSEHKLLFTTPLPISHRAKVTDFLETGVAVLDLLVPLGHGQRELLIGDRKTGKSKLGLQIALHLANQGVTVIIALIGKRAVDVKSAENYLEAQKVRRKCVIVATTAEQSPGEVYLTPFTAMAIAEHFRDEGKKVFVLMDDLTTHAKYYRELSLVAGRFPGRESYPGDIFHVHSQLLERAGAFTIGKKTGTISCLALAESLAGDMTGYIQTNLMSMTDGHIYLDTALFFKGIRPAVNTFLSVTRVGRQTQSPVMRDVSIQLIGLLKRYEDIQRFLRFGPELSDQIRANLQLGDIVMKFFQQSSREPMPVAIQLVLIALIFNLMWDGRGVPHLLKAYQEKADLRATIDGIIAESKNFPDLQAKVRPHFAAILAPLTDYENNQNH